MWKDKRMSLKLVCLTGVLGAGVLGIQASMSAQSRVTQPRQVQADDTRAGVDLAPSFNLQSASATLRTNAQMLAAEQSIAYPRSKDKAPSPFLKPTIDIATYRAMKDMATQSLAVNGPQRAGLATPGVLGPPGLQGINAAGVNQTVACACIPPDTHGAVGNTQYVQIVNSWIRVFDKATMTQTLNISLNSFFGFTANLLFDPRAIYDDRWDRWILTAEGTNTGVPAGTQPQFIAISTGPSATGSYWIYNIDVDFFNNGAFWDYPQLGMDIDSLLLTANIFPAAGGYAGADVLAVSKALVYNGLGFSVPVYTGLPSTTAPPIVRDDNRASFFLVSPVSGTTLPLYKLRDSGRGPYQTFTFAGNVTVAAYAPAPDAPQPGVAATLDTLDARFQNASSQQANFLWNIHTVAVGGPAGLRWYRINVNSLGVNQTGTHVTSGTSSDFNPAITTDNAERTYVVFSSTDTAAGTHAQIRFTGKLLADAALGVSTNLFTSPVAYLGFGGTTGVKRWGDYASASVDPTGFGPGGPHVWLTNQVTESNTVWATRIARVGY